ncbi:MAG: ATP-binding protein [Candidatus Methylumidiphilus sp.]
MSRYPYHGLRPFNRDETDIFFGREQHTDELITRLGKQHFLAVVGYSGCGKSSLVRTGLIPSLQAGFLAGTGTHWQVAELRPGNQPFANLAKALAEEEAIGAAYRTALIDNKILKRGSLSLQELLAIKPMPNNAKLLIVCDQFEEIFRYYEQGAKSEAEAFIKLLLSSCLPYRLPDGTQSRDIYVVLTMRSDFLGDCALFAGLAEAINDGLYLTPRLTREQLREAIEEPALVFGGEVAPDLVVQLLEDAAHNPDQLPLLQHALMIMWQKAASLRVEGAVVQLTLALYQEIGMLKQVLSNHADSVFNEELSPEQQAGAEILFKALCERASDQRDTRRPQKLSVLAQLLQLDNQEVIKIIEVFRHPSRSFLVPPAGILLTADSVIDISHESFIRQWQKLKDWVEQEARAAEKYQRLLDNAERYQHHEAALLQSPELEVMQDWFLQFKPTAAWAARYTLTSDATMAHKFALAMDFLQQSVKKARLRKGLSISAFVFVAALAGVASWQWYLANTHRHRAELATQSMNELRQQAVKAKDAAQLAETHAKESAAIAQKEKQQTNVANKLLAQFAVTTIESLAKQNMEVINQYTDDIFNAGLRDIFIALLDPLIAKSESLDDVQRQYWRDILPSMTDAQVKRLLEILFREKLEEKYQDEVKSLNENHLKEWVEYSITSTNKNNPETYLSASRAILESPKIEGINVDDTLKYLSEYKNISAHPEAKMYYLYGKYYQIKDNKDQAKLNYTQAVKNGIKGAELKEIYDFLTENKEMSLALEVATKMANDSKIQLEQDKQQLAKYKIALSWKNKDTFNKELGEFLENIKLEGSYLQDEFLTTLRRQYGKPFTSEEQDKILQTFKIEFKPEIVQQSKLAYIKAVSHIVYVKSELKEPSLTNDIKQTLQLVEEIKATDLSVYLNYQSSLALFYSESGNISKALQISTDMLAFYETSKQKYDIKKSWIAVQYGRLAWYELLENKPNLAIISATKGLEYDADETWIKTNLAHSYLLNNDYCAAEKIHLFMRDEKVGSKQQAWKETILDDFKIFTEKNITHPDMKKSSLFWKQEYPVKNVPRIVKVNVLN